MIESLLGVILLILLGIVSYLTSLYFRAKKVKKEFDAKRKEFNELEQRTLDLQLNKELSKEELKFEQECLIMDAAYLDKKYGIEQYYNTLLQSEKGKT
jgi:predicted Holliday junction resolvase-like endonuclease